MTGTTCPRWSRLVVDESACARHGLCYGAAPELLDCDDLGNPVVTVRYLSPELFGLARKVVENCPERALAIQPESDSE